MNPEVKTAMREEYNKDNGLVLILKEFLKIHTKYFVKVTLYKKGITANDVMVLPPKGEEYSAQTYRNYLNAMDNYSRLDKGKVPFYKTTVNMGYYSYQPLVDLSFAPKVVEKYGYNDAESNMILFPNYFRVLGKIQLFLGMATFFNCEKHTEAEIDISLEELEFLYNALKVVLNKEQFFLFSKEAKYSEQMDRLQDLLSEICNQLITELIKLEITDAEREKQELNRHFEELEDSLDSLLKF